MNTYQTIPRQFQVSVADDITLTAFEWSGDGPPILLVHATGFHARVWNQVVAQLPGCHIYAVDLRGHGRSDTPEPPVPWHVYGEDIVALVEQENLRDIIGVGHSMGGHSVTVAAGRVPERFAGLLLLDPVIRSPEDYKWMQPRVMENIPMRKRRNEWSSADEMVERFRGRPPFNAWRPEVLRDYCDYGILPNPDGKGFVLACPPEFEASVYTASGEHGIFEAIDRVTCPVTVIRGRPRTVNDPPFSFSPSVTWPELAARFAHGRDEQWTDCSHFLPMEAPAQVAAEIERIVEQSQ